MLPMPTVVQRLQTCTDVRLVDFFCLDTGIQRAIRIQIDIVAACCASQAGASSETDREA